jgi:hypothetical protein
MPRKKKQDYKKYYLHEETGFSILEKDIGNFPTSSLIIVSPSDWYKRRPVKAVLYGEKEYAFYDSPDMFDKIGSELITDAEWSNSHLLDAATGEPTALRGDELADAKKTGNVLHRDVRIKRVKQLQKELGDVPLDLIAKFKDRKKLRPDLYQSKKKRKSHQTKRVTMKKTAKHSTNNKQNHQKQDDIFGLDADVNREKPKPHFDFSSTNPVQQKDETDEWIKNLIIADSFPSLKVQGFFSTNAKTSAKEHLKQEKELNSIKPKPV